MRIPEIGDLVSGRYRLDARLGKGGFGAVFQATDLQMSRQVALKVLYPDDDEAYLRATRLRFEREVEALEQLKSRHTVRLLDHGSTSGGLLYLVFEYLPGRDLSEVLHEGPLPPRVVEHILRQLLGALAEAHRAGLTHRDIKPANVRVMTRRDDAYYVKLMDFGIARSTERDRVAVTKTGELIGTLRYMSPEQLRDQELTAASDIYCLGVLVVEMLCGPDALPANNLPAQFERLTEGFRFSVPPTGNPRLDLAVRKMTAVPTRTRSSTVGQVLDVLDRDSADPNSAVHSTTARWPLVLAGLFCLGAVVGGVLLAAEEEHVVVPPSASTQANSLLTRGDVGVAVDAAPDPGGGSDASLPACHGLGFSGMRELSSVSMGRAVVYVPKGHEAVESMPLMIVLEGKFDRPKGLDFLIDSGLADLADEKKFVIVSPQDPTRVHEPWEEPEDLPRVSYWADRLKREACIDADQVYVVMQSDASFMSHFLRCEDWVTAIGANGSRHSLPNFKECPGAPTPTIWIVPRDTHRMPEVGGNRCVELATDPLSKMLAERRGHTIALADFETSLQRIHGCRGAARTVHEEEIGRCVEWDCETPVRYCTHDGGEPWPGTSSTDPCLQAPATTFSVNEQIWTFLTSVPSLNGSDH